MKKGLRTVLVGAAGIGIGALATAAIMSKKAPKGNNDKFKIYYNTLNQWLKVKNQGKNLADYFKANNYQKIAIYGMGELGNRLYEELKDTGIDVAYGIDQCAQSAYNDLKVYSVDDRLGEVDVIVVTAVFAYEEIRTSIKNKVKGEIISLEDVVFEM